MPEDVPTPLKGVYVFIEFVALGCVLSGVDVLLKQQYWLGVDCILVGAVCLFIGIAGLRRLDARKNKPSPTVPADALKVPMVQALSPQLSGVIEHIWIGTVDDKQGFLLAQIAITNLGAPSIAEVFRVFLKASDSLFELKPVVFATPQHFTLGGVTTTLATSDMIFEKTSVPVTIGSKVRGWLFCPMSPEAFEKIPTGPSASLRFQDVNGVQFHSADVPIIHLTDSLAPVYAPGVGQYAAP